MPDTFPVETFSPEPWLRRRALYGRAGSGHPTDEALLATLAAAVEDIWRHYDCRGNARPSPTCSWNSFHAARTTSLVTNGSKTMQPVLPDRRYRHLLIGRTALVQTNSLLDGVKGMQGASN